MRRAVVTMSLVLASLAAPASAGAAADRSITFATGAPPFAYHGGPISGVGAWFGIAPRCTEALKECDATLAKLTDPGDLKLAVTWEPTFDDGIAYPNFELCLLESDADGARGDNAGPDYCVSNPIVLGVGPELEIAATKLAPGYYRAEVNALFAPDAEFDAVLTFKSRAGAPAPPPPPAVGTPRPAPAAKKPAARKRASQAACRRKARRIKRASKRRRALRRCSARRS